MVKCFDGEKFYSSKEESRDSGSRCGHGKSLGSSSGGGGDGVFMLGMGAEILVSSVGLVSSGIWDSSGKGWVGADHDSGLGFGSISFLSGITANPSIRA